MAETDGRTYLNLALERDLLASIDDFRFSERVPSRTEAIRRLIREALASYKAKGGKDLDETKA